MSVAAATKIAEISSQIAKGKDPKRALIDAVGKLDGVDVLGDLVLVATFVRSEKRASGLFLPQEHIKEDEYQGKVGLVLKNGPLAFADWED